MKVRWIESNKYVLGVISMAHKDQMQVFATFSNPAPSELSMHPEMMTEYGLRGADAPLIKYVTKWEYEKRDTTEVTTYWLAVVKEEES